MSRIRLGQKTRLGKYYIGDFDCFLNSSQFKKLTGKIQLILTSPPFPLNKKKSYGNLNGEEYKIWFESLAVPFSKLLKPNGSVVIEMGNAWVSGRPVQSLLHIESLMQFVQNPLAGLRLCQQFVCYNPARLPSPAEWVTIQRIRLIDGYTHLWWIAKNDYPKADNKKILRPYSDSMRRLLKRKFYNSGKRPSEHKISKRSFLKNNGGSICSNFLEIEPSNVGKESRLPEAINALNLSNTSSNDFFLRSCRKQSIRPHPARMPTSLAAFFIEFLTDPGDLVLDPFAGSNTTGYVAERLKRRWMSVEIKSEYARQSLIRFKDPEIKMSRQKGGMRDYGISKRS